MYVCIIEKKVWGRVSEIQYQIFEERRICTMKTVILFVMLSSAVCLGCTDNSGYSKSTKYRENGWYRIIDGQKDSIASRPIVTVKEFASLRIDKDFFGKAVITGSVSKHKLRAWADSTEQLVGKRMGFMFNDSVITAPRVNMRLESGAFQITTPGSYDISSLYRSLLKEKKDSLDALFKAYGWENDTFFFNQLDQEKQDSVINTLDYIDACAIVKGFGDK